MGWIGKLFKIVMFAIILGTLAGLGFIIFVNPNSYKEKLTLILQNYTGLPFKINGTIDWILRPDAIFKFQDVTLESNTEGKTPAVQIKDMVVKVDLASAFKDHLVITNITINTPVVDWMQTKEVMNSSTTSAKSCTIDQLTLKNGTFTIQDPDDGINWLLKNVSFTTSSFMLNAGQDLPALQLEGDLINVDRNTTYTLETTAKFDLANHVLTLDPLKMVWNDTPMQGTAIINQFDTDPVFSGNFSIASTDIGNLLSRLDPYYASSDDKINNTMQLDTTYAYTPKDKVLDLTKLSLQIDKGTMTGDVKLGFTSPYHAEFNLSAQNFNFVPLKLLGSALLPESHTTSSIPTDFIKQLVINGKFTGTQLSFNESLAIDQIQMEIKGQGGVMQLMPVIINAYGGTHDVALLMDVNGDQPKFQITEQANKVNLEPWLKLLESDKLIEGSANLKASLEASGRTLPEITQNMSGGISLFITDGTLYGVDVTKLMQFSTQTVTDIFKELSTSPAANMNVLAIKKSSNWIQTQADNPNTKFDHFELNVDIENGVSKKANIAFNNNIIELKGTGSFVLKEKTVNFDTSITNRIDMPTDVQVLTSYIKATPLSMTINGTLDDTTYGPNVQGYVTGILKTAITDIQTQALAKMLAATPANDKTDKTATELFLNSLQSLNK